VNTLLADPPAAADAQAPAPGTPEAPEAPLGGAPERAPAPGRTCANCGAPLGEGQDWCLRCGTGAPGSLAAGGPGWRSAATILAAAAALAIGAGAAAYAALSKGSPKPRPVTATVAQTTPAPVTPTTATPTTPGSLTPTPTTPTPKLPGLKTPKALLPKATKPPKIPLTTPTPKAKAITPALINPAPTPKTSKPTGANTTTAEQPQAITLDTNAAATYNPYSYPASDFGDPSLAIDGEPATGWTAQVEPSVAPKMAEGLVLDLKSARRLSALTLVTSTPGMTVQVYGAAGGKAPPTSITAPAWTRLSPALVVKKRETKLKLKDARRAFRFVTLWISKAPANAIGTPQAPGRVSVNELELFPAK
jgi:hypothetical protein